MIAITVGVQFSLIECGHCGISFAVPEPWRAQKQRDHTGFKCPNGCALAYNRESEVEVAKRQQREAQARLSEEQHRALVLEREVEKLKAEAVRIKSRISRGACTCCNRTFKDLASHMKIKHPKELPGGSQKQIQAAKVA